MKQSHQLRLARRLGSLTIATLIALSLAFGCSTNKTVGEQISDSWITGKVKTKLAADPQVNPFEIDVDTDDGVVRLSGVVGRAEQSSEAEKLARDTNGVSRVINELTVGDPSLGSNLDDAVITGKIQSKLTANTTVNNLNIDVDTQGGVVSLKGKVSSEKQRAEAERVARETKGVRKVRNLLEVRDLK